MNWQALQAIPASGLRFDELYRRTAFVDCLHAKLSCWQSRQLALRLERFAPGTPFATIAEQVGKVVANGGLGKPPVIVDLTAVGTSVLRMLRSAVRPAWIVPVTLIAGQEVIHENSKWQVPKRDLVTGLQLLLQARRLQIAALPDADTLVRELTAFRGKVSLAPADAIDWRDRPGDDLVLAVGLACWWSERHPPRGPDSIGTGRSPLLDELDRIFPHLAEPHPW